MVQVLHILPPSKIFWGPRKFRRQTVADFCLFLGRRACVLGDHPLHRVGYVHSLSRPSPRRGPPCPCPARPDVALLPVSPLPGFTFSSCSSATVVRAAPLTLAVVPASSALFSCGRSCAAARPPAARPPAARPHAACAACASASSCALHKMSSAKQMYDDLLMAKNLLDKGILTQEEYEREKRAIMARRSDPSRATRASSGPRAQPAVVTPKRPRTVSPATAPSPAASTSTNGTSTRFLVEWRAGLALGSP